MEPFYWLIALALFLIIEIITLGLTTIWFAGGALVGFLAAVFHVPVIVQILLFLAVSIILLIFTRPVAERYFNNNREKTNVNGMIGKEGKVTVAIDNFNQTGTILVNGVEWTARSCDDQANISRGAKVIVRRVEGVRAFVEEVKDH